MFTELKMLQQQTGLLREYLEQENPDLEEAQLAMNELREAFKSLPKTKIEDLTEAELTERGTLISGVIFDQIKIDYLMQIHTNTVEAPFNDFLEQRLENFFEYAENALNG